MRRHFVSSFVFVFGFLMDNNMSIIIDKCACLSVQCDLAYPEPTNKAYEFKKQTQCVYFTFIAYQLSCCCCFWENY